MAGRIVFYPYKIYSASCRDIVCALKKNERSCIRVYPDRNYIPRADDTIINWGNSNAPIWDFREMLNKPERVALSVNKIKTFEHLASCGVRHVPFTTDIELAKTWENVVERHKIDGHSGEGIRICKGSEIALAPLYTEFLYPTDEYRVHVFKGKVIDYSKKYRPSQDERVFLDDGFVKNKANGWGFLRSVRWREGVCNRALEAVKALGLDFGSVDIIRYNNKSYVLEVGTAAGLSEKGVELYTKAILEYADSR